MTKYLIAVAVTTFVMVLSVKNSVVQNTVGGATAERKRGLTMRLIDADALMEAFRTYMAENHDREKCVSEENCNACDRGCLWRKIVVKAPTIDPERLVVLPCKVGDTVYWLDYNRDACGKCDCYSSFYGMDSMCDKHYELWPCIDPTDDDEHCPQHYIEIHEIKATLRWIFDFWNEFGKTVFHTQEEAEAALKGGADDER